MPDGQLHARNSLITFIQYTWQATIYLSRHKHSQHKGTFQKQHSRSWCFNPPSRQLTSASSFCLRGGSIATVAREASREAGRDSRVQPGQQLHFVRSSAESHHKLHDLSGSKNQQLPKRPFQRSQQRLRPSSCLELPLNLVKPPE